MNFTVCLDYNSPNYNPANLSTNGFSVYSDSDNFTTPITTGIPASLLFPPPNGTCPFNVVNIPNNATQLLIVDQCVLPQQIASIFSPTNIAAGSITIECCYALIDIDESCRDFCSECEIGFDVYSVNTTGSIIAGNLTSSCGTVTDYVIGWYLNGSTSASFTSGFGNQFVYPFTHPLTGSSSPLVAAGSWKGIIHDAIINGTQYTSLASGSGVGSPIPFQSCFGTVVASPLTCVNGPFTSSKYSHQKSFTSVANGVAPQPVSFTYQLSPSIKYFAYNFSGYNIWDELEIKYISGNPSATTNPTLYSNPIYLEKIRLGSNAPNPQLITTVSSYPQNNSIPPAPNVNIPTTWNVTNGISDTWPKNSTTVTNFKRTLTLTNLETSSNPLLPDSLIVTVTPNTSNTSTNWDLKMQCLQSFICGTCTFDTSPPYQISNLTLLRPTGNPCIQQRVGSIAIGCTSSNDMVGPNSYVSSDNSYSPFNDIYSGNYSPISGYTACSWQYYITTTNCTTPTPGSIITFSKTNVVANGIASTGAPLGKIYMTFNNFTDYSHYKNDIIFAENALTTYAGPYTPNCSTNGYYAGYTLEVPYQAINANCGDNTTKLTYSIHRSAYSNITYVENAGASFYSITIPMPECLDCLTFGNCTDCYISATGYTAIIDRFNQSSFSNLGNQITYTNNNGSKYNNPFGSINLVVGGTPNVSGSLAIINGTQGMTLYRYPLETVPFVPSATSPTGWSNLPQLGGTPCPAWSSSLGSGSFMNGAASYNLGGGFQGKYFNLNHTFLNVTASANIMNNDFKLFTEITNNSGDTTSPQLLIYTYSQSIVTVNQPSFFVGGSPTLTIQPF